jgi:nitrogen fixation/metabolism regulation signal transduction histidine kinase
MALTPVSSAVTAPLAGKSLRAKFVRLLLSVSSLMALATTAIVVVMSVQASAEYFSSVQGHIQDGIISKGKVLTENHALALRGLALDNAFLDMQRLVERAVKGDQDLVYGVFVSTDRAALALSRRGDAEGKTEPPDKEAWRTLGLNEGELLVKAQSVKRVTRLGQDLLEVAVPVESEEHEALGTIRYGLSTARMHEALAHAKHDASSRLWRSVLLIVGLVGGVTALGLVLSRAQAVHITQPVSALTQAAESLAAGDRSVHVDINSGDELAVLGSSFNRMVEELNGSYGQLEQMNRTLEQKVEARTAELALKNRDMRLVLDNVDQGFINLSPQGVMATERSAIVSQWFGASDRSQPFWDYISHFSRPFAVAFRWPGRKSTTASCRSRCA